MRIAARAPHQQPVIPVNRRPRFAPKRGGRFGLRCARFLEPDGRDRWNGRRDRQGKQHPDDPQYRRDADRACPVQRPAEERQRRLRLGGPRRVAEQPVEVTLRSPVPLDAELAVTREADGSLRMLDGETLVAEARAVSELDLEVPEPVSVAEARRGTTRYRGLSDGEFSNCFVCGGARDDSLGVFPGEVEGRGLVATPRIPPS